MKRMLHSSYTVMRGGTRTTVATAATIGILDGAPS
jgi:hypothetical protein